MKHEVTERLKDELLQHELEGGAGTPEAYKIELLLIHKKQLKE